MTVDLQTYPHCGKPRRTRIIDYPPVMNEAEAAEFLGILVKTVSDYTRAGKIPHIKLGRRVLIGRDQCQTVLPALRRQDRQPPDQSKEANMTTIERRYSDDEKLIIEVGNKDQVFIHLGLADLLIKYRTCTQHATQYPVPDDPDTPA
jgi:excisionase family DNA binding protein